MAVYRLMNDVATKLERIGLSFAALAAEAQISRYGLRDKLHKGQRTRGATAWKLAHVYAKHANMPPDRAFAELFVLADDTTASAPAIQEPTHYIAKLNAGDLLERTQLSQAEIARRSGVSKFRLNALLRKRERSRGSTAWSIARVYAQSMNCTDDQALDKLFEEASK